MDLVFVWVDKIRNLENLCLNFSNEFVFSYNRAENIIDKEVNQEVYINKFYGEAISSLTAVIGQNGVGKSTLFHLIRLISNDIKITFLEDSVKKGSSVSEISYVAIFKIGELFYYFKNGTNDKIKCVFSELGRRQKNHVDNFNCFYYANFFDYSSTFSLRHTIDVSTTALVNDSYLQIRDKTIENEDHIYEASLSYLYKTNEIFSQLQFVAIFDKHLPFELPSTLAIRLLIKDHPIENDLNEDEDNDEYLEETKYYEENKKYLQAIAIVDKITMKYRGKLSNNSSTDEKIKYIKTKIQQAILSNLLQDNVFHSPGVVGYYELNFDITAYYNLRKVSATKNLDKLFVDLLDLIITGYEDYIGRLFLKWVEDLVGLIDVHKHYNIEEDTMYINLAEINIDSFLKLIGSFSKFQFQPRFIDFFWEGISSGENALITIFSRFFTYRSSFSNSNSSLLLILDECEINFHPAWQRKLVYFLTTIFPLIFSSAKIQFFISSHSPLILSDIPKSDIIFLQKTSDGKISISHLSDKKQTFAANIHTLLSDAFFMDEGTIGEIAKEKINWLIDNLSKRYIDFEKNFPLIESLVEIIGEPVIKSKLISMINEKHSLSFYNINQRVQTLEKKGKK